MEALGSILRYVGRSRVRAHRRWPRFEDLLAAMQGMAASDAPAWHIMLHYSPGDGPMNLAREAPLAQVMEAMSATGRVRFYSTVPAIAEDVTVRSPSHPYPAHLPVGLVYSCRLLVPALRRGPCTS